MIFSHLVSMNLLITYLRLGYRIEIVNYFGFCPFCKLIAFVRVNLNENGKQYCKIQFSQDFQHFIMI